MNENDLEINIKKSFFVRRRRERAETDSEDKQRKNITFHRNFYHGEMTFSGIFLSKNICMTAKMKMSDDDISHLWSSGRARDAKKWGKEEKVFHHFSSS